VLDEFDKTLLNAIDEILQYTIGDVGTKIIFDYLERNCFPKSEIPVKLNKFSEELRRLLGPGKGQILGSAPILEEAIAERLCSKLGMKMQATFPLSFPTFILKLKGDYYSKRKEPALSVIESPVKSEEAMQ
jgi:hypothetical protein